MDAIHRTNKVWLSLLALALLAGPAAAATNCPTWWDNVIETNVAPNDFAPATQGQLKWVATNAFVELESNLPGGAGDHVRALVSGFPANNNYLAVNLGQLKCVATSFYDRLIEVGFATTYPWTTNTTADDSDFAVANLGQLKNVFNFSLSRVYADSGIMTGCVVRTWYNVATTNRVTPTLRDGGFEQSTANGTFPDSGYWAPFTSGGEAGAVCSSNARYTGTRGLWNYTGNSPAQNYSAPFQTNNTLPGDVWIASAYVRQTSSWVPGTKGFVRLKFLNSLGGDPGWIVDSPTQVTFQNQNWTYCSVTGTAPSGAYFVRMEMMIEKPSSSYGVAVVNFDHCYLQQCNGFLSMADYANFGEMPEGSYSFRTFAVNQAGWGVFRTNGTINLSAYTNGYLKFWLKSCASSRVEIATVTGITTNKSTVGGFSNTIAGGSAQWQMKSIPVNAMTNVNLSRVASPFMFTDMGVTNSSFVDCVYWVKAP